MEQPGSGYRFSIDAVLLARFATATAHHAPDHVIDLGAGCGVVGLLVAQAWPECQLTLVEIQAHLAAICRRNAQRNGMTSRTRVVEGDLREIGPWAEALAGRKLVVCNPPYFSVGCGRVSGRPEVAVARHEVHCTLEQLVRSCSAGLQERGEVAMIHAAPRREALLALLEREGFGERVVRLVRPLPDRPPTRILVHATRAAGATATRELSPLIVNDGSTRYSAEVRRMLNEED